MKNKYLEYRGEYKRYHSQDWGLSTVKPNDWMLTELKSVDLRHPGFLMHYLLKKEHLDYPGECKSYYNQDWGFHKDVPMTGCWKN